MTFAFVITALEILKRYWGYSDFRAPQDEIIQSVIDRNDTLALLPTGGGKSLCYQVPAMVHGGLCLVISPLTALMQDQVDDLNKRGVKAKMISSYMKKREVDWALNECVFGNVSFLYISPERLLNKSFQLHLQKMPVTLVAIDEAHCIAQWGYDFRPAYLEIEKIRNWHPKVPFLALTATATEDVKMEIIDRLQLKEPKIIEGELTRKNLAYAVTETQDKSTQLINWLKKISGSKIIYAQSRLRVTEISSWLVKQGFSSTHYHAGLSSQDKREATMAWMNNEIQIMVATNAFGMGINKPDVQAVIHWEMPYHPEAYFQEAGRAGRGGQKAYGLLMFHPSDKNDGVNRIEDQYPAREMIQKVYQFLCDGHQLPIGDGQSETFSFHWQDLAQRSGVGQKQILASIQILQSCGYLQLNEASFQPSIIRFLFSHDQLIAFKDKYDQHQRVIEQLLRMYGVSDHQEIRLDEWQVAKQLKTSESQLRNKLMALAEMKVWSYTPQNDNPTITFLLPRVHPSSLIIPIEKLEGLKNRDIRKWNALWEYVQSSSCRSVWMNNYFGKKSDPCGVCDICINEIRKTTREKGVLDLFSKEVIHLSDIESLSTQTLREQAWEQLRIFLEEGEWEERGIGQWKLKKN